MLMFEERVNAEGEWRGRKGRMKGGKRMQKKGLVVGRR